ncbi:MAG TPA: hypothetical protein VF753_00145 [Terriglobales bacterium]
MSGETVFRKVGLGIAYFVAILYILLIVSPAMYCLQHKCWGPDLDGFMPAFFLSPWATVAMGFTLGNAIQHIRKKQSVWLFWPLVIVFAIVLLATIALLAWIFFFTAFHRPHIDVTEPGK